MTLISVESVESFACHLLIICLSFTLFQWSYLSFFWFQYKLVKIWISIKIIKFQKIFILIYRNISESGWKKIISGWIRMYQVVLWFFNIKTTYIRMTNCQYIKIHHNISWYLVILSQFFYDEGIDISFNIVRKRLNEDSLYKL